MENRQCVNTRDDIIRQALADQHARLGQHDRPTPERSITARNYDSHIYALGAYMLAGLAVWPWRRSARDASRDPAPEKAT